MKDEQDARGRSEAALKRQLSELKTQAGAAQAANDRIQREKTALENRAIDAEAAVLGAMKKASVDTKARSKAEDDLRDANQSIADAENVIEDLRVESALALDAKQEELQAELDAIAACIIGGASFFGGRGTVLGVFAGVMIMGILRNGLNLMDVSAFWQQVLIGAIIVIAVYIDVLRKDFGTRK